MSGDRRMYELVAPDGGWGYMICVAVMLNNACMTGFVASFGMLYKDFFEEVHMESTTVTLLGGIQGLFIALNGFITAPLLKVLTLRQLALMGSTCFIVGLFGIVFATSKIEFILYSGIFGGAGFGIVYNVSCTVFNDYFVKKRLFAFSLIQIATASQALIMPTVIKLCLDKYGFRGTQLIIAGIALHMYLATALIQPVERHVKKIEIHKEPEAKLLLYVNEKSEYENTKLTTDNKEHKAVINVSNTKDILTNKCDVKKESIIRQWIESFLNISAIRPLLKSTVCWSLMLCTFCELNFTLLIPQGLYSFGWNENEVSFALSLMAFGDLATRILIIIFTKWLSKISSNYIYLLGVFIAIITRLVMIWTENKIIVYIAVAVMGMPHCTNLTFVPLVIAEIIEPDKFAAAMGFNMLLFGFGSIILGPIVGALRDLTDSYVMAFYMYILMLLLAFAMSSVEICYKNYSKKVLIRNENKVCNK